MRAIIARAPEIQLQSVDNACWRGLRAETQALRMYLPRLLHAQADIEIFCWKGLCPYELRTYRIAHSKYCGDTARSIEEQETDNHRYLKISFEPDAREIMIIGTYLIPEFGSGLAIMLSFGILEMIATKMNLHSSYQN